MKLAHLLAVVAALVVPCLAALPAGAHDKLGANLNFIADFFRNHEFNDLVKQSRAFLKPNQFDDGVAANRASVGPDGWPTEDFKLFVMAGQSGVSGLGGTYRLTFTLPASLITALTVTGGTLQNYALGPNGTASADIVVAAGVDILYIDFTNTNGAVKNVRLLRPGVPEAGTPMFTSTWLAHTGRFNVLRFLDWTRTNGNRHVDWSDRTTPEKLRTEALIAQWETVIAAANALGRDAWINVPVQASDEYVTNLATLFRDTLNPGLNLYVEYGNELWNFSLRDDGMDAFNGGAPFNGATVNRDLAAASPPGSPLRFEAADNTTLGFRRVALRLKEISDIFRTVWGASAINTRVRPVLAGQMANSFIVSEGLRLVDEGLNVRPSTVFYAIAGAPYIFASGTNDASADEAPGMTAQQILDGMAAGVANAPGESSYQYLSHAGLGAWYGLKVLAYEAGFDSFGPNNVAAKRQANLDPRIRTICADFANQWHAFGFEHLLWFNGGAGSYDTQFGMWPVVEDMGNPNVPKNQCMDDILAAALPAMTAGTPAVGAPIAGGNYRGSANTAGAVTGNDGPFGFPGYVEYLLRVDAAGTYNLVFTGTASPGETFQVLLNNASVATNVVLPTSPGNASPLSVTLRQGLNALRLRRATSGGTSWSIASLAFTLVAAAPTLGRSATSVDFGGQSMGTTSPARTVTLTNTGGGTLTISSITVSSTQYARTHDCGSLAPAATCTVTITFTPTAAPGAVNAAIPVNATLAIASDASGSPHTVALSGTAEKSLVTHYYRSILRRDPDSGGKAFWQNEAARVAALGANVNEVWYALSAAFYVSPEYAAFNRDDTGFVTDLYVTFFNRAPDPGGLNFWVGNLSSGMPREVALAEFMFSAEFRNFSQAIFGNVAARAEVDMAGDFYRGLLARLPDDGGLGFWVGRFRAAQCQGAGAVTSQVESISSAFTLSPEYAARNRSTARYVGDLYNAFLRRGGDLTGVQFWIDQIATGARTRENVRIEFKNSAEFQGRVNAVIAQGCL